MRRFDVLATHLTELRALAGGQTDMRITGTFEHQEVDCRTEGYGPSKVSEPLHLLEGEHDVPLDTAIFSALMDGKREIR